MLNHRSFTIQGVKGVEGVQGVQGDAGGDNHTKDD